MKKIIAFLGFLFSSSLALAAGTVNTVPKYTSSSQIGNSAITEDGTGIGLGRNGTVADLSPQISLAAGTGYYYNTNIAGSGFTGLFHMVERSTVSIVIPTASRIIFTLPLDLSIGANLSSPGVTLTMPAGTVAAPSIRFVGADTGFYSNGGGNPCVSVGGTSVTCWTNSGPTEQVGTDLSVGNNATISNNLTVANNVSFSSTSVVSAYFTASQTVTAASTSTLTWTEVTDKIGQFDGSTFTVTTPGLYEINVTAGAGQTAGTGCLLIKLNGATIGGAENCATGATALATVLNPKVSWIQSFTTNDLIRIDASATTANVAFQKATLTIKRIP